jgi:glutamate/tyrosine decarboxylase-like PLP-dependent enzyme
MSLEKQSLDLVYEALERLEEGFKDLPDHGINEDMTGMRAVLMQAAQKMQDNYPYHHPLYAGQMLKPPHPIARLAYMLALWVNPNNHALDGGRASSGMEKEAVAEIARMFGWESHLGHLCGGGTMANMEALWVSENLHPGKKIVASDQAHYTHNRLSGVLNLPFQSVPCDHKARMDVQALEEVLRQEDVGTVVATMGTTAAGAVDPLPHILDLQQKYSFRLHADAAYGGYFTLAQNLDAETRVAFDRMTEVDSVVVDPHKHGLQPYGCGCVLFKDSSVGRFYKHDSPYTYFSSADLHLGEISLECSRAGASAVALWSTLRMFPLTPGGTFAKNLERCRQAALSLYDKIRNDPRFLPAFEPELDIVVWAPRATKASQISQLSQQVFTEAAERNLHLAVANFPKALLEQSWDIKWDQEQVACLRSCLMKAEHLEWVESIWQILDQCADQVMDNQ